MKPLAAILIILAIVTGVFLIVISLWPKRVEIELKRKS